MIYWLKSISKRCRISWHFLKTLRVHSVRRTSFKWRSPSQGCSPRVWAVFVCLFVCSLNLPIPHIVSTSLDPQNPLPSPTWTDSSWPQLWSWNCIFCSPHRKAQHDPTAMRMSLLRGDFSHLDFLFEVTPCDLLWPQHQYVPSRQIVFFPPGWKDRRLKGPFHTGHLRWWNCESFVWFFFSFSCLYCLNVL